jgi:TetR/AcrR family transcriptional repressor of nem operon
MAKLNFRDKIVEAGLEVIYEHGFNGCSVQDITEAAGVPKGSFYNYFKSKEALAAEIVGIYEPEGDIAMLHDASVPALKRLRRYFEALSLPYKSTGFKRGCLLGNLGLEMSDASETVRSALEHRFGEWQRAIAVLLKEGQTRGEVNNKIDARQFARFLVASWEGALIQMKVSRSARPMQDFLDISFLPLTPSA